MPGLLAPLYAAYHRALDLALRVDSASALNSDQASRPGAAGIAEELYSAVQEMKAQALDEASGAIDYAALAESDTYARYRECTGRLCEFDPATLRGHPQRLAFWTNLYNALVIDAVIRFRPEQSVREDNGFFRRAAYIVGGQRFSADDIEHGILRGNRRHFHPAVWLPQFAPGDRRLAFSVRPPDPRVHCALVCASRSCPPIAVYEAPRLDDQLDLACAAFVNGGAVRLEGGHVLASRIFRWYGRDFGGRAGVREFLLRYLDAGQARSALEAGAPLRFQDYDWSLNGVSLPAPAPAS
jgi:hypothetical protein